MFFEALRYVRRVARRRIGGERFLPMRYCEEASLRGPTFDMPGAQRAQPSDIWLRKGLGVTGNSAVLPANAGTERDLIRSGGRANPPIRPIGA